MQTKLNAEHMKQADYSRQLHRVTPPEGVSLEDAMEPTFWVHLAHKFTVGDKVEVFPEGGAWYGEFIVRSCSRIHAKLGVLTFKEFGVEKPKNQAQDPEYLIEWKGPNRKFAILRRADKELVKENFADKDDAAAWLEVNRKELV